MAETIASVATYTHIINGADKIVEHNGSGSGWDQSKRHAANKDGHRRYKSLCSRVLVIDEYDDDSFFGARSEVSEGLDTDKKRITCANCRKKLGLSVISRRRF